MSPLHLRAVAGLSGWGADPACWMEALQGGGAAPARWPEVQNPGLSATDWATMSPLSRAVAAVAAEALADLPIGARQDLPILWATGLGELGTTETFLTQLFIRGRGRPRAFRDSVHNTAASWLAVGQGWRGPSETLVGGAATCSLALLRARALLRGAGPVLVLGGDDPAPAWQAAMKPRGATGLSPCAVALLLDREGPGPTLRLHTRPSAPEPDGRPLFFGEDPTLLDGPAADAQGPPAPNWSGPTHGFVVLAALARAGGGRLVERSGSTWISADLTAEAPPSPPEAHP